jgi:hypothetical protein
MLERLDVWLAILTLGALAWYELRLGRFFRPLLDLGADVVDRGREELETRRARRRSRPLRDERGQFNGSLPAVPDGSDLRSEDELRSDGGTALESHGTGVPGVPGGTISQTEIALIALRLGQRMPPGKIAKSLPGYSGRKYAEYMAKVEQVRQDLGAELVEEEEQVA